MLPPWTVKAWQVSNPQLLDCLAVGEKAEVVQQQAKLRFLTLQILISPPLLDSGVRLVYSVAFRHCLYLLLSHCSVVPCRDSLAGAAMAARDHHRARFAYLVASAYWRQMVPSPLALTEKEVRCGGEWKSTGPIINIVCS